MAPGLMAVLCAVSLGQTTLQPLPPSAIESPRSMVLELKLGSYRPLLDLEAGLTDNPFGDTFGTNRMLLFELQLEYLLWKGFGTVSAGGSFGYAEKFGRAILADGSGADSAESTGFRVIPLKALAAYRFDVLAERVGVPLVPYAKLTLHYTVWWVTKGTRVETFDGRKALGGKWGLGATLGLALQLDFFEPRLARDFDNELGVNHTYLFAEYAMSEVNDFGAGGFNLSSRHWMFGLAFEF